MLSRTADHLFWMARYMERAENTARMLDVNYQMSLLPQSADAAERGWRGLLSISELTGDFAKRYGEVTPRNVMDYMVRDADQRSSIRSCLLAARENARAVRGTLTTEVWETQNQTWLEFQRMVATDAFQREPGRGLRMGQVPLAPVARRHGRHDAAGRGVPLPAHRHLPRARRQHRAPARREVPCGRQRVLRRRRGARGLRQAIGQASASQIAELRRQSTQSQAAAPARPGSQVARRRWPSGGKDVEFDFYHWSAVLRSVSGFEVYRKVYRNVIRPEKVAELLILRPDMPRSLAACMNEVVSNLQRVANEQSKDTLRRAGRLSRPAVRPHRRDPGDRPARLPDAVPRPGQRARRRHQPRLPRARRAA